MTREGACARGVKTRVYVHARATDWESEESDWESKESDWESEVTEWVSDWESDSD